MDDREVIAARYSIRPGGLPYVEVDAGQAKAPVMQQVEAASALDEESRRVVASEGVALIKLGLFEQLVCVRPQ